MITEKRCPSCGAEYRSDVQVCADCNIQLVNADEEMINDTTRFPEDASLIAVGLGSVRNIQPLVDILESNNIKFRIDLTDKISEAPHPDSDFQLMIEEKDVPRFNRLIEEFKYEEFPELAVSKELMESGCCPACGAKVGDETVCPECELPLVIIEDEDED